MAHNRHRSTLFSDMLGNNDIFIKGNLTIRKLSAETSAFFTLAMIQHNPPLPVTPEESEPSAEPAVRHHRPLPAKRR